MAVAGDDTDLAVARLSVRDPCPDVTRARWRHCIALVCLYYDDEHDENGSPYSVHLFCHSSLAIMGVDRSRGNVDEMS